MARIDFAPMIQRQVACAGFDTAAPSLAAALDEAFAGVPGLRDYLLDDQGCVRRHVAVFINGSLHHARADLSRALHAGDRIYVVQALSGG